MPAWALKVSAMVVSLLVLTGSWSYAALHVFNPSAPLQPPVETTPQPAPQPVASGTPIPALLPARPGIRRPSSSPGVIFELGPGVAATALPNITITRAS